MIRSLSLMAKALRADPTGDEYLDGLYDEFTKRIGHERCYYRFLHLLASELQPSVYVELGVDEGYAIAHVASGYPDCRCIGIDPWIDWPFQYKVTKETCSRYPNIELIRGFSTTGAREAWKEGRDNPLIPETVIDPLPSVPVQIDMLFIDARHRKDLALLEWDVYGSRVPQGGVVICDDVGHEQMDDFWKIVSDGRDAVRFGKRFRPQGMGVLIK